MAFNMAVILAAGAGTRMKSKLPKVLHQVCGKSMLEHVISEVRTAEIQDIVVIVGHGSEEVIKKTEKLNIKFALQEEQLGTGHAVMQAREHIPDEGNIIVLCGDTPLISSESISHFIEYHERNRCDVSVLTADFDNPAGYGRIVRGENGNIVRIVEEKDASEQEKLIKEINSGIYCFKAEVLKKNLGKLSSDNSQNEYYLTDIVGITVSSGGIAGACRVLSGEEILGVNSRMQLAEAERIMRSRIVGKHMANGVTFINPLDVYIDKDVKIGMDSVVYPGVILKGTTAIGEDCILGHNTRIENSKIGNGVEIQSSVIIESEVSDNTSIGPYAYLRPGSKIGSNVKIGDFVEVKNAVIGNYSKASHLAYIGDAEVGENVNIGCGVVFVNYDGVRKHRSVVGDNAFIGSNANLVAPVTVGKSGFVAAGTTVTLDVPENALCVGRVKQKIIEGWADRKNNKQGGHEKNDNEKHSKGL